MLKKYRGVILSMMVVGLLAAPGVSYAEESATTGGEVQADQAAALPAQQDQDAASEEADTDTSDTDSEKLVDDAESIVQDASVNDVVEEPIPSPVPRSVSGWSRIFGKDQFDTMQAISKTGWSTSENVVIATDATFWDALAANALAGVLDCPVLLTRKDSLSWQARDEIKRLGAKHAYICGGPIAIASGVDAQVKSAGCSEVTRVFGQDQQGTSLEIAKFVQKMKPATQVIVATSTTFQDALSIAPYAYATKSPILICASGSNTLLSSQCDFIAHSGIKKSVIVGGPIAVSNSVEGQLNSAGATSHERIYGQTEYETSDAIARWELNHGMNLTAPAVATGSTFYDALAGASLCGKNGSVLVIASTYNRLPLTSFISDNRASISGGYVFGGEIAVSSSVYHTLEYCWKNGYSNDYATDEEAPYKAVYNYEYYRANNPDVKQAFGNNRQATLDHFLNSGMRERRRGCEGFDVRSYYNQYEDLRRAFAVNWPAYYRHFMEHGQREGRAGTGCGAVSGWQYHNVPWHGQPNNFYCGPTSGQMILEAAGKWGSANGTPLNVWNVAKYMHTNAYHFTSFNDRWFERGMNDWLGYRAYTTLHTPSYGAARDAVMRSYDRGLAAAVDAQERRGGPHFNGHNNGTFSHIMVVDGYNNANDHVIIADPGAKVLWGGASQKFEYPSFNNFITTYCQHEIMGDGKQHIGMYVPV